MTTIPRIVKDRIIGTRTDVYTAWVPSALFGGHISIRRIAGEEGWWGQVGLERELPPELNDLPRGSEERIEWVRAWHEARYAHAYDLIIAKYPEAAAGVKMMGSISVLADE
jgi:hypothetical protein